MLRFPGERGGLRRGAEIWARRHRDLARSRNQAACRLHAVLCDLVPGGMRQEISAGQAARLLEQVRRSDAVASARCELAAEFLADIRRLDAQRRATHKKLAAVVATASKNPAQPFDTDSKEDSFCVVRRPLIIK